MTLPAPESDLLRQMVRQVLLEIVPQTLGGSAGPDAGSDAMRTARPGALVSITSDADLQAFARRIAASPQAERDAILAGALTFSLDKARSSGSNETGLSAASSTTTASASTALRVDKGAVTERHVRQAAEQGGTLVLGPKAVLTPLARDRARAARVEITREK